MSSTKTMLCLTAGLLLTTSSILAGPPTICHPLDIGKARSLPFGDDAFEPGELNSNEVVPRTVALLDQSDSATVHQETLRRAYIYIAFGKRSDSALVSKLIDELESRILLAEAAHRSTSKQRRALHWFDLAVFLQMLGEESYGNGEENWETIQVYMARALELDPTNGELALGAAVANQLAVGDNRTRFVRYMHVATSAAEKQGGLLEQNALMVLRSFGRKFDTSSIQAARADLARAVKEAEPKATRDS